MRGPADDRTPEDGAITRRDFLNGMALAVGGCIVPPSVLRAAEAEGRAPAAAPYPPALTGLRGSHDGSFEAAHLLRDGLLWERSGEPVAIGEEYDLIVVGAGISGLAAAHFFRERAGRSARILLLDNHDDFGGHARRNEFTAAGRYLIAHGGTAAIDSPAPYSTEARALVRELGIDVGRWKTALDESVYASVGLQRGTFFDRETFGADRLVPGPAPWGAPEAPLSPAARRDLARLDRERRDFYPGLGSSEKKARLARISYASFLTTVAGFDRGVLPYLQARPHSLFGVGIDAVSALDAWGLGYGGFAGLGLDPGAAPGMNLDAIPNADADAYYFHFPDGNATLARRLVQRLVPRAVEADTVDDLVTARIDYGRLDEPSSPVRIRLESTVVRVRHEAPRSGGVAAGPVEVTYAHGGRLATVRARKCILACWHTVIPYVCPELPEEQKTALAYAVKVPLVYTSVLLRDWTALARLGISDAYAPGSYHTRARLPQPVSVGRYLCPRRPEEPVVLHLSRTPCLPGRSAREQHRAGRLELLTTPFATFEVRVKDQLARMLAAGGFDPERDIRALTVNRWPHGYAYQYNSLWDDFWREGKPGPCVAARRPFGSIAIANADAAAYAYTDAAIDQAYRAVRDVTA